MNIKKFEHDLKKAYLDSVSNKVDDFNDEFYISLSKFLSPILLKVLNSYYFNHQYKKVELSNEEIYTYNQRVELPVFKDTENHYSYHMFKEYLDNDLPKGNFKHSNFENVTENTIMNQLKKDNSLYEILFEDDPLKQKINLLKKNDLKFEWIYVENNLYEKVSNLHKIAEIKNNYSFDNLQNNLNEDNDLKFVNFDANKNRYFLIAYNDYEVAGIASLPNASHYKDLNIKDNIKTLSYLSVSKPFRGQALSVKMFDEILSKAEKDNWIILRSSPSDDGNKYLKSNIDKIVEKNSKSLIISYELLNNFYQLKDNLKEIHNKVELKELSAQLIEPFKMIKKNIDNHIIKAKDKSFEDVMILIEERNKKNEKIMENLKSSLKNENKTKIKAKRETKCLRN